MADSVTRVRHVGRGGKGAGFAGVLFGFALFLGSFVLLFWNEKRAVETRQSLEEGVKIVKEISAEKVDPALQGGLVHMTGGATTTDELNDSEFGIGGTLLRLRREVSMYQWVEDKKTEKRGDKEYTTYTYTKDWRDEQVDSGDFEEKAGHTNPAQWRFNDNSSQAENVTLGAFKMGDSAVAQIDSWESLSVREATAPEGVTIEGNQFYVGANPKSPAIGDMRIEFEGVKPVEVSIVAKQDNGTLLPYTTSNGRTIEMLSTGKRSAKELFDDAFRSNTYLTWALRVGGWFMMFIGLSAASAPLLWVLRIIPLFGGMLENVSMFLLALLAGVLSLVTIAIAWFVYRPVLSMVLVAAAIGLMMLLKKRSNKLQVAGAGASQGASGYQSSAVPPPPPPPPPPAG